MKSSLIPEKPILIYPSLAATVGLEEACLLSVLNELSQAHSPQWRNGFGWYSLPCQLITEALPFFSNHDIQRVCQSLRDKGILLIGATWFGQDTNFLFAFNEKAAQKTESHAHASSSSSSASASAHASAGNATAKAQSPQAWREENGSIFGKNFIAPNWQPDEDTLAQLHQHNIPSAFALQHVPAFVTYWRERNEAQRSWGSVFLKHVLHQWRKFEAESHARSQETHMHMSWRPSADALQVLREQACVSMEFIEDAIPEFILYWQERGDKLSTWNSKFIQHVKLQWHKYQNSLESGSQPLPIAANWQPSEEVYDVLRLANIDIQFARSLLAEFVMYWRESGQVHTSWNTRFLQYVKKQWAKRHALSHSASAHASVHSSAASQTRSTREISLEEELGDRSWAN